jgi:hypothetical protein
MTFGIGVALVVALVIYLWRWQTHNGDLIERCATRHGGRARSGALNEGYDLAHRGVGLWLRGFRPRGETHEVYIEVRAAVRVRPGIRLWAQRNWIELDVTRMPSDLRSLPLVADVPERLGTVHADRADALEAIGPAIRAWTTIAWHHTDSVLACDGRTVTCIVAGDSNEEIVEAMLDAVAAVATWDDGFSATLHALPGATPLPAGTLDPAVAVAPDNVVIGVLDGERLLAFVDAHVEGTPPAIALAHFAAAGAGTVSITETRATYEWSSIERDPARIRSAIEGLRALRTTTPYR